MFDTLDERASAQGTFLLPLLPDPDGLTFSGSDLQQVQGVYSGLDIGPSLDFENRYWLIYHHHYDKD